MDLHLITSKHLHLGYARIWSYEQRYLARSQAEMELHWIACKIFSLVTSKQGVSFDHEQLLHHDHAQAWSWIRWHANNLSSLITRKHGVTFDQKHLQHDHKPTRSRMWSRVNIPSLITRKLGVALESPLIPESQAYPLWLASSQPAPTLSRFLMP